MIVFIVFNKFKHYVISLTMSFYVSDLYACSLYRICILYIELSKFMNRLLPQLHVDNQ